MAVKKKEFKDGMSLAMGKVKSNSSFSAEEVEKVVQKIHKPITEKSTAKQDEQKVPKKKVETADVKNEPIEVSTKKAGVVLPMPLFEAMKIRSVKKGLTISKYFESLLVQDLEKNP